MTERRDRPSRASEAFFGRRKGKALRPAQERLLAERLPALRLDLGRPPPEPLAGLFRAPVDEIRLEIGFGGGEHLLHRMGTCPRTGFIGVEPFVNGMAKFLAALAAAPAHGRPPERSPSDNLRLHDDDAAALLDWLPAGSIDHIDLLYPDPWPKRRHWKRRFVGPVNLDRFARVLKPGGRFCFASDIAGYVDWTLIHCRDHHAFTWTARDARDWRAPFAGWPGTRYEAKALRAGRRPAYLTFTRR